MGKLAVSEEASTPSQPSTGSRLLYPKSDGWYELDDQGVENRVFSSSVFGNGFQEVSNQTSATNTSTTYATHTTMTIPNLILGSKIRLGFTVSWNMSTAARNIYIRATLNGTELGLLSLETKDTGTDIRNWNTSFFYIPITAGNVGTNAVVSIEFRPQNGSDTATLYYSGLECWRVS